VLIQGTETVLGKRGVYITLQSERRKRYSMAEVGNLKNERNERVLREGSVVYAVDRTPLICCCNAQHTTEQQVPNTNATTALRNTGSRHRN